MPPASQHEQDTERCCPGVSEVRSMEIQPLIDAKITSTKILEHLSQQSALYHTLLTPKLVYKFIITLHFCAFPSCTDASLFSSWFSSYFSPPTSHFQVSWCSPSVRSPLDAIRDRTKLAATLLEWEPGGTSFPPLASNISSKASSTCTATSQI